MIPKEFRKMASMIATVSAVIAGGGVHIANGAQDEVDRSVAEAVARHVEDGHPRIVLERVQANTDRIEQGEAARQRERQETGNRLDRMEQRLVDRLKAIEAKL